MNYPFGFLVLLLWSFFVFGKFFPVFIHPWDPIETVFDSGQFSAMGFTQKLKIWGGCLTTVAVGIWCVGSLWSCGRFLRKWIYLPAENEVLGFCLELGLGFFFINTLWMGLGLTRLWFEPFWVAGVLILSVLMTKDIMEIPWGKIKFNFPLKPPPGVLLFCLGIGFFYYGFLLLHSFLPETFYDSLNYFLGMPHFWLFQHGITDYPTHLLSGYFHGGSLFYMYAFLLGGTEGAKILSVFVLGFNALFAFGWVKEKAGVLAGVTAAVAVTTFPLIYLNAWAARVDGLSTFIALLFFFCLEKACMGEPEKCRGAWMGTAALFAGLALSIKPTAIVGILAAFMGVLLQGWTFLFRRKSLWLAFPGFILLETGPWLLKNAVFTANPFFPYAISWMGGRSFPLVGYDRLLGENRQFLPMDHGFLSLLTLPWRLTMPQAGDGQWIGPLFLAFLPALFFLQTKDLSLKFLTKTVLLGFVLGLYLSHMLRFVMPFFVLCLLLFSVFFFVQKGTRWKTLWITSVLASAILFFGNYLDLSAAHYGGSGIWRGLETRQEYLDQELPNSYEPLARWTDENLPQDARLLIVGDSRGVYYERPYFAQSVFDEPFFARAARRAKDAGEISRQLRQLGVTHLAVNIPEGLRVSKEYHQYELSPEEWERLDDFFRSGLKPIYWRNFQGVYEIKPQGNGSAKNPEIDPFSFFSAQAYDFVENFQLKNFPGAEENLSELLVLFPQDDYWRSQKALLRKAERESASTTRN